MSALEHEELRSLLGAYVLDAVDPLEHRRLERHISSCAECAHEVRLLREASTELAWLPPPEIADDLVERISASLPRRPRRMVTRVATGVAAISIAVAGFLGATLVHERAQRADFERVVAAADQRVRLSARKGFDGDGSVYVSNGRAALVLDKMPDPGRGRAYQLWAINGSKPVSMAVVGGSDRIVRAFSWHGRADSFAVTIEPDGGSPVPTSNAVLVGS